MMTRSWPDIVVCKLYQLLWTSDQPLITMLLMKVAEDDTFLNATPSDFHTSNLLILLMLWPHCWSVLLTITKAAMMLLLIVNDCCCRSYCYYFCCIRLLIVTKAAMMLLLMLTMPILPDLTADHCWLFYDDACCYCCIRQDFDNISALTHSQGIICWCCFMELSYLLTCCFLITAAALMFIVDWLLHD